MSTRTARQTAHGDQVEAASRQARRVLADLATACHGRLLEAPGSPWLAEQAAALAAAVNAGTVTTCPHLGPSPRVAHAAVWAPGRLVCPHCVAALVPNPTEDGTCDRCRRHVRRLHAGATALGPVILTYGLCRSCATTVGLAPDAATPRR